ncbi:unnamed protein product [Prorocentrum cordatum]|uniref:Uncharacterized protein n=1 Tax=Prorocentrum cordatum TaxID=2364126 RepID=A0ABN9WYT8_9DINO|nr:unnamed protein product [Polarella glacialis]
MTGVECPGGRLCNCCHYYHGPEVLLAMKLYAFLRKQGSHGKDAGSMPVPERAHLCRMIANASMHVSAQLAASAGGGAGQRAGALAGIPAEADAQVPSPPAPLPQSLVASWSHLGPAQLVALLRAATPQCYED